MAATDSKFSANLKKALKAKRVSLREAAEAVGLRPSTIGEWTNGRAPTLSPNIIKLARFLGVTVEELVTGEAPEPTKLTEADVQSLLKNEKVFASLFSGVFRLKVSKLKDDHDE